MTVTEVSYIDTSALLEKRMHGKNGIHQTQNARERKGMNVCRQRRNSYKERMNGKKNEFIERKKKRKNSDFVQIRYKEMIKEREIFKTQVRVW